VRSQFKTARLIRCEHPGPAVAVPISLRDTEQRFLGMPIMNSSRVRILIVAIAALTGAIPAATQVINPVVKSSWQSFLESLSGILWAALAIGTTLYLSKELKNLLWSVVQRLKSGSAVKIGPVEFGALNSIPAAIPEGQTAIFQRETSVSPHWKVEDLTEDDGTFRAQWDRYPAESKYAMLVHSYFPSSEPGQVYDVLLYFVEQIGRASCRERV